MSVKEVKLWAGGTRDVYICGFTCATCRQDGFWIIELIAFRIVFAKSNSSQLIEIVRPKLTLVSRHLPLSACSLTVTPALRSGASRGSGHHQDPVF